MGVSHEQENKQVTQGGSYSLHLSPLGEDECKNRIFQMIPQALTDSLCGEGGRNTAMPVTFARTLDKKLPSMNTWDANLAFAVQRVIIDIREKTKSLLWDREGEAAPLSWSLPAHRLARWWFGFSRAGSVLPKNGVLQCSDCCCWHWMKTGSGFKKAYAAFSHVDMERGGFI